MPRAITFVHSGQTGVERGVHRAALEHGLPVMGFSSHEGRDELGRLPESIASVLRPCERRGVRSALLANLEIADGLVVVVPNVDHVALAPGVSAVLARARRASVPFRVVDLQTELDDLKDWASSLDAEGPIKLMITGPRETRWAHGEREGVRVVNQLAA